MLSVPTIQEAVIDVVGACNPTVKSFLIREKPNWWCLAQMEACEMPLLFLVAQRYAIDAALDSAATMFDKAEGTTKIEGDSVYASTNSRRAETHGQSFSWGCDWADAKSFREFQRRADAHSRGREYSEARDGGNHFGIGSDRSTSSAQGQGYSYDKSDATHNAFDQSSTSGGSASSSTATTKTGPFSETGAAAGNPPGFHEGNVSGTVQLPPYTIDAGTFLSFTVAGAQIQVPSEPIAAGQWKTFSISSLMTAVGYSDDDVRTDGNGLGTGGVISAPSAPNCSIDDPDAMCDDVPPSLSADQTASLTVHVPIPFVGSFAISITNRKAESVDARCGSSSASGWTYSQGTGHGESHDVTEYNGRSDSESKSTDIHDVHRRAERHSDGEANSASATNSVAQAASESHDGGDRVSHGEGKSTSNSESTAKSTFRGAGHSDDTYESFGRSEKRSQMFDGLKRMRGLVEDQIKEAVKTLSVGNMGHVCLNKKKTICPDDPYRFWLGRIVVNGCNRCGCNTCVCRN